MSLEPQVIELFRRGNPVPEQDTIGGPVVDADLYLDSLQRSDESDPVPDGPAPAGRLVLLAAAAVAVVLGVAFWIWSLTPEDVPPATDPSVTTSTSITSTSTALDVWEQIPTGIAGQGGEFRTQVFAVPFSIDLPVGWHRKRAETNLTFTIAPHRECNETRGPGRICPGELYVLVVETDLDAIVGDLQAIPGATVSRPEPVVVGGATGVTFDLVPSGDQPFIAEPRPDEGPPVLVLPEDMLRVYVVEVQGSVVAIQALSLSNTDFLDDSDSVVESIVWRDLR